MVAYDIANVDARVRFSLYALGDMMGLDIVDSIDESDRWDTRCILAVHEMRKHLPDATIYLDTSPIMDQTLTISMYCFKKENGVFHSQTTSFRVENESELPKVKKYLKSMNVIIGD